MKTTTTADERKKFSYQGDTKSGVTLLFDSKTIELPSELFDAVIKKYTNRTVLGGFNETEPPEQGLAIFMHNYARTELNKHVPIRCASHLCAILRDEGLVTLDKDGSAITVTF